MTVTADEERRVVLTTAQPGDRFDLQPSADGYLLRKLGPAQSKPAEVRFIKRDGYTVAITDQPINEDALRQALEDFP